MNIQRKAEEGNALVYIFALCLLLSAIIVLFTEKIKLTQVLNIQLEQEIILSLVAEDLTELALAHLSGNKDGYDAPQHFQIPASIIKEVARGYPVQIEIRDEGSCFNPNNLPVSYWRQYFRHGPQMYERLVNWYFQPDAMAGSLATPVRSNYLLTPEELAALRADGEGKGSAPSRLTVFGPASYYLLDGEVFVSLLKRCGLRLSPLTVETIIEQFDAQQGQVYSDNLETLLSQLRLPERPPLARLERILTTKGIINPNFVEAAYLRTLLPAEQQREFVDLKYRQQEQPFTSLDDFAYYLHNTHGVDISAERLRHLFSVQSKILGIKVAIYNQTGTEVLLTVDTVVERRAGIEETFALIYRRKKWGLAKEEGNE